MIAVVVTMLTAPAIADPDRCAKGLELAKTDLPRAALYLDGCTGDDAERATADVATKLRASQLSALSIESDSPVPFETDAMPGEHLTAPATIWAKAGTYKIRANGVESSTVLPAHTRATVFLAPPLKPAAPPKQGTVTFNEGPTDPPVVGPPPAQKHPSLLPCRYDGCDTHDGEQLVDPLAVRAEELQATPPELRIGARLGVAGSEKIAPSFAVAAHWSWLALRFDGSPRERDHATFTDLGFSAGISHVVFAPDAAWISVGAALRGDARASAPMGMSSVGLGANAELELALRRLPATVGARYEQGFGGEHAVIVELGFDWRHFK
jgi:hypothetical protein